MAAKSILVTGGAGYIGSHTVLQLLLGGFKVIVIDNLDNSSKIAFHRVRELAGEFGKNLDFHKGDLRDKPTLEKKSLLQTSLSSESPTDSPISIERKTRVDQARREVSNRRSPRKHVKSRSFTNHKDMRSETLELNNDFVLSNGRENGAATISGNTSNCSGEPSENLDNDFKYENANLSSVGMAKQSPKILKKEDKDGNICNGCDKDGEMEQALAHKAQLICRYEVEENAHKEWEEKFRDNNSSLDSYEVGNRSDITEGQGRICRNFSYHLSWPRR